jgi:hypothetical protein
MGEEDEPAFFDEGIKFSQLGLIRSPFAICSGATGGCEVGRGVPDEDIAVDGDGDGERVFGYVIEGGFKEPEPEWSECAKELGVFGETAGLKDGKWCWAEC